MNMTFHIQGDPIGGFLSVDAGVTLAVDGLTEEQIARLRHHLAISCRVFRASAESMLKGVKKYGPEPDWDIDLLGLPVEMETAFGYEQGRKLNVIADHWLPHIFSEMVDGANQTGLLADTLGVEL